MNTKKRMRGGMISIGAMVLAVLMTGCGGTSATDTVPENTESISAVEEESSSTVEEESSSAVGEESNSAAGEEAVPASDSGWEQADGTITDLECLTEEQLECLATEYNIYTNEYACTTFNGYGTLLHAGDIHFSALQDVVTGDVKYYVASYTVYEKKEDDSYSKQPYHRLYSPDGTILTDWSEETYVNGVGDWVVAQKYDYSEYSDYMDGYQVDGGALFNPLTGERQEGIWYLEQMDDTHVVAMDSELNILGLLDEQGNPIVGFPLEPGVGGEDPYMYTYKDYVVVSNERTSPENMSLWIFDADMTLLGYLDNVQDSYIYNAGIVGPYILCDGVAYDPTQGGGGLMEPIFGASGISYLDEEIAIVSEYDANDETQYYLYSVEDGKKLTGAFSALTYCGADDYVEPTEPVECLYGCADGNVYKLSRDGEVLACSEVGEAAFLYSYHAGIVCTTEEWDDCCLLDNDLNVMVPYGTYSSIYLLTYEETEEDAMRWSGYYEIKDYCSRIDIMKQDGEVVLKGCTDVGTTTSAGIPVSRGQSVGVVDLDGNWIYKISQSELTNAD